MSVSAFDPEWVAFTAGIKPAIRITTEPGSAGAVAEKFTAQRAHVARAEQDVAVDGRPVAILYVARTEAGALELRDVEARALPGRWRKDRSAEQETHLEMGRLLGFPRCCVEAFCARVERGVGVLTAGDERVLAEDYVAARDAWVPRPDARLNNLLLAARVRLVTFYPCRYDCPVALRYASAVLDAIARKQRASAEALSAALARPVAIAPWNARAVAALDASGARVERAEAPRTPDGRLLDPRDEALASALAGASVGADGALSAGSHPDLPPVWLVPFGPGTS